MQELHFSPFHFHRIFKYITNETLNEYVTRQRIEKSASDLLHQSIPISQVSLKYGFKDSSSYTRAFKKYFQISPSAFKIQNANRFSKNSQVAPDQSAYLCTINNLKKWIKMNGSIEVKEMPRMNLAYVSFIGEQQSASSYQKIIKWATPRGLMNAKSKMITIYRSI